MRKMIRKGERASAKDFLNCFVLPIAEAKARKEFDELMKKYGKKSGSGYVMSIEDLLKVCDELEKNSKPLPAKEEGKTKPNEEGQSTNPSDRVAGETPAREEKKMKKNIQKKPLIDPINPIATGSPEHYEYEEKGFAVISSEDPW